MNLSRVKNTHVFVTHEKNLNEFFTGVTNTCEFFTRLKLDICGKRVPIKIPKLIVRIFHTYQNVTYTACEKYEVWILRFNVAILSDLCTWNRYGNWTSVLFAIVTVLFNRTYCAKKWRLFVFHFRNNLLIQMITSLLRGACVNFVLAVFVYIFYGNGSGLSVIRGRSTSFP